MKEVIQTTPKELMKKLKEDGWVLDRIRGSHHILKHPSKPGRVTLPLHKKDLKPGALDSILKQAGLK